MESFFFSSKILLFKYFKQPLDNERISNDCENHIHNGNNNNNTTIQSCQLDQIQSKQIRNRGQIVIEKYENSEIENTQSNGINNNNAPFISHHQHNFINSNNNSYTKNILPSNNDHYKTVKSKSILNKNLNAS